LLELLARLPTDRAFTPTQASDLGIPRQRLRTLVAKEAVRPLVRGLYAVAGLELTVLERARAIALVVPPMSVVTDETAAWIHGLDLLDHRGGPPPLSFVRVHGDTRLRREGIRSGTRMLKPHDVILIEGISVTTPLRTAVDLGRRLRPDRALAALDGFLRTPFVTRADLEREVLRFKGFRGVVQLRALIPLADPRAESPAESKVRFEWLMTADLPRPELQIPIENPYGFEPWRLDLGVKRLRYGVEYDGLAFHSSPEQRLRDRRKRTYLREELGWVIDVLEKADVYGSAAYPMGIVRQSIQQIESRRSEPASAWRWPA
jgi:hypothetical protein